MSFGNFNNFADFQSHLRNARAYKEVRKEAKTMGMPWVVNRIEFWVDNKPISPKVLEYKKTLLPFINKCKILYLKGWSEISENQDNHSSGLFMEMNHWDFYLKEKPNPKKETQEDIYSRILESIVLKLRDGVLPWRKTWGTVNGSPPKNILTKKPYKGFNLLSLSISAHEYGCSWFGTKRQILNMRGGINRDAQKHLITSYSKSLYRIVKVNGQVRYSTVYFSSKKGTYIDNITKKEVEAKEVKERFHLKYFEVYNIQDTTLPLEKFEEAKRRSNFTQNEKAEALITNWSDKPKIKNGGDAFYKTEKDTVHIPHKDHFNSLELYYSTLFHELIHSTGSKKRLSRSGIINIDKKDKFKYAYEELIAELGASFLCGFVGIEEYTLNDSASYINGWLSFIEANPKYFLKAAFESQKAVRYILENR